MKDLEIHSLICHKDVCFAINCIESLIKNEEFSDVPIYFHEDGSLTDEDVDLLKNLSSNIYFIFKKTADEEIKEFLVNHPNCYKYRLGDKNNIFLWHKIKSFDYFFFSKTKKILCLDTDLLFINKPLQLIEYIEKSTPCYFPDLQNAYCFNDPKDEIPTLPNVNTGIIFIPGEEYYNINSLENALSNLIKNDKNYFPSWIEQSAFAHMFYVDGRYKSLDFEKNRIPFFQSVDYGKVECLHFVSYPAVRELYKGYIKKNQLKKGKLSLVSENNFLIEFKDKKVPLNLKIYENENFYDFEFEWGIDSVGINALSHQFKIKNIDTEKIYEFGSSKFGFFICKKAIEKFDLYHTYEWYGEKKWNKIVSDLCSKN